MKTILHLLFLFLTACSSSEYSYEEREMKEQKQKEIVLDSLRSFVNSLGPYSYTSFFNFERDFGEQEEFHFAYTKNGDSVFMLKGNDAIKTMIEKSSFSALDTDAFETIKSDKEENHWRIVFYVINKDLQLNAKKHKITFDIKGNCKNTLCSLDETKNFIFEQIDGGILFYDPLRLVRSNTYLLMHAKKRMIPNSCPAGFLELFPISYYKGETAFHPSGGKYGRLGFYSASGVINDCAGISFSTGYRIIGE